jgi:hypothetical protein
MAVSPQNVESLLGNGEDADPVEFLARAFEPLMAEFQACGVGVAEWITAIKIASYQAARNATDAETGRAHFARMSVRTGMTRTELTQIREQLRTGKPTLRKGVGKQRTARVIEGWQNDPAFQDGRGQPRPLALRGESPSLETVIRQFAGDVPFTSVFAELQRQNLIVTLSDGRYLPGRISQADAAERARQFERMMTMLCAQSMGAPYLSWAEPGTDSASAAGKDQRQLD